MQRRAILFIQLAALIVCAGYAQAQRAVIAGQMVDVLDGRTVVVQTAAGRINVELQFIDVPVAGQPMSDTVREHLRSLVSGKTVDYRVRNLLSDRTIGKLSCNSLDVGLQMLRDGAAWHVPARLSGQDADEFQLYTSTEAAAKSEKRGIWSMPDLKPSWERSSVATSDAKTDKPIVSNRKNNAPSMWGDKNPRLGDLGALISGYNAASRKGFVGLPMIGVSGTPQDIGEEIDIALSITYYYRESDKGRNGSFIVRVLSDSRKLQFLSNNDLSLLAGGKTTKLGKPTRTVTQAFGHAREELTYQISKSVIERMVNYDDVLLKVGGHLIHANGARYLLYNLLQIAE